MNDERRRYFRIDDTVGVAYRILSDAELNSESDGIDSPISVFTLLSSYDTTVLELLQKIGKKDPLMEEVLITLNKKINCVINQLQVDNKLVEKLAHQVQEVNISACGMAFAVEEDIHIGQTLSLDITLHPDNLHVFSYGTVVHSEPTAGQKGRFVRVNFHGMRIDDQEILIQHIVKRQSLQLRYLRESRDQAASTN